jgi:hypothetical protein
MLDALSQRTRPPQGSEANTKPETMQEVEDGRIVNSVMTESWNRIRKRQTGHEWDKLAIKKQMEGME